MGNLFGAISDSQHVAPSSGSRCVQKEQDCAPRPAFTSTRPGDTSAETSELPAIFLCLQAFHRVNQWTSSNCTTQGLSTTRWSRVIPVGRAIASPQADATWRGVLWLRKIAPVVWEMTQHRDPGSCSFRSFPRATSPGLSSSVSNPLFPPSTRA